MQLMPALLSYLNLNSSRVEKKIESATTIPNDISKPTQEQIEKFLELLDDGIDFGVVVIYVCPNSCIDLNNPINCQEHVIVQPPADISI